MNVRNTAPKERMPYHMKLLSNKYFLPVAACVCIVAVVAMLIVLFAPRMGTFTPPPFDEGAQQGDPSDDAESDPELKARLDSLGYSKVAADGMSFSAMLCGVLLEKDGKADVYLTNFSDNTVWMKLRITDSDGNILGETGLIKPGEYVRSIEITGKYTLGQQVRLKIMTYEPETYYSAGSANLNTVISKA